MVCVCDAALAPSFSLTCLSGRLPPPSKSASDISILREWRSFGMGASCDKFCTKLLLPSFKHTHCWQDRGCTRLHVGLHRATQDCASLISNTFSWTGDLGTESGVVQARSDLKRVFGDWVDGGVDEEEFAFQAEAEAGLGDGAAAQGDLFQTWCPSLFRASYTFFTTALTT